MFHDETNMGLHPALSLDDEMCPLKLVLACLDDLVDAVLILKEFKIGLTPKMLSQALHQVLFRSPFTCEVDLSLNLSCTNKPPTATWRTLIR